MRRANKNRKLSITKIFRLILTMKSLAKILSENNLNNLQYCQGMCSWPKMKKVQLMKLLTTSWATLRATALAMRQAGGHSNPLNKLRQRRRYMKALGLVRLLLEKWTRVKSKPNLQELMEILGKEWTLIWSISLKEVSPAPWLARGLPNNLLSCQEKRKSLTTPWVTMKCQAKMATTVQE